MVYGFGSFSSSSLVFRSKQNESPSVTIPEGFSFEATKQTSFVYLCRAVTKVTHQKQQIMKQGFNVQFYCRSCKCTKNGQAPLEVAININGVRRFINTQYRTTPEIFHRKKQPKDLVDYQALMRSRINEILTEMLRAGEAVTTQSVVEYLKNGGYRSYTVVDLFEEYLSIMKGRVGKSLTKGVYRKYELVRDLFYAFIRPEGEIGTQFTHANVMRFKVDVEGRYEQSTAAGYLRKLKSVAYFAIDNGRLSVNPFQGIKVRRGEKPIVFLTEWEQNVLRTTPIENESLARVRDCAVFQMATGLAYADLKDFRRSDIKERNGVKYIEKPRRKTGKVFTTPILKPGLEVLEKYDELPVISNEKYNTYLKTIQHLCNIRKNLTSHVFRKTAAMNMLNSGLSYEVTAAAMGHSVKVCAKYYAKLQRDTIIDTIYSKIG